MEKKNELVALYWNGGGFRELIAESIDDFINKFTSIDSIVWEKA